MIPLSLLTFALAVQFGKKNTWATSPIAKVTVTARGPVSPDVIHMHILEAKQAVAVMLKHRDNFQDIDLENIEVEVNKRTLVNDENVSVCTNVVMSMCAGACTVQVY